MKLWRRWDPRLEPIGQALRDVRLAHRWLVEVVPDLFAPSNEPLRAAVFTAIGKLRYQRHESHGRFMLRTAHPATAVAAIRRISDANRGCVDPLRGVPSRLVLALYAETQDQFESGVATMFAPRVKCEDVALVDPEAGIALAVSEGLLSDSEYDRKDRAPILARGPQAMAAWLRDRMCGRRSNGIPVDSGGLALYLSPRERIDIGPFLAKAAEARAEHGCYPQHAFDWVVCAGRVGPLSPPRNDWRAVRCPRVNDPHPMHPRWVEEIGEAAETSRVPFCVPYVGEWGQESIVGRHRTETVDYDPSWAWGERGWNDENRSAKPHDVYLHAVGAALAGRAVNGRTYDNWPEHWHPR